VLHYLEDWTGPLAEFRRVLTPGGRLIAAVDHPFAIELMHREQGGKPAYFETRSRTEEWTFGGHSALTSLRARPREPSLASCSSSWRQHNQVGICTPAVASREEGYSALCLWPCGSGSLQQMAAGVAIPNRMGDR